MPASRNPVAFFTEKKPWSRQKDAILQAYIPAYIQKISREPGKPVLIVDGFAGPGVFGCGDDGSPLLIAKEIEKSGLSPSPRLLAIERDPTLFGSLAERLRPYAFAECRHTEFTDVIAFVAEEARSCSTFLYLDPFAIAGLRWDSIAQLLKLIRCDLSVELLLNFNAHAFVRRARAALRVQDPSDEDIGEEEDFDAWRGQMANADRLDAAVGGAWWRPLVNRERTTEQQVGDLVRSLSKQLTSLCQEACFYEVFGHWRHRVPKYVLLFATRSPVALTLMNDAMYKGHEVFLETTTETDLPLFRGKRMASLRRQPTNLDEIIRASARGSKTRQRVVQGVIHRLSRTGSLGLISTGGVTRRISKLRDANSLRSDPPRGRMNDSTIIWCPTE